MGTPIWKFGIAGQVWKLQMVTSTLTTCSSARFLHPTNSSYWMTFLPFESSWRYSETTPPTSWHKFAPDFRVIYPGSKLHMMIQTGCKPRHVLAMEAVQKTSPQHLHLIFQITTSELIFPLAIPITCTNLSHTFLSLQLWRSVYGRLLFGFISSSSLG